LATAKQKLGDFGETTVAKKCSCPKCKRPNSLKKLPTNFKCADIICDFCGFLAQVKTMNTKNIEELPSQVLGAAWGPQKERMDSGIYFPLFLVLVNDKKKHAIYYLSAGLQEPEIYVPRKPLSSNAKRAGWQGFIYDISKLPIGAFVRIL